MIAVDEQREGVPYHDVVVVVVVDEQREGVLDHDVVVVVDEQRRDEQREGVPDRQHLRGRWESNQERNASNIFHDKCLNLRIIYRTGRQTNNSIFIFSFNPFLFVLKRTQKSSTHICLYEQKV